MRLVHVRIPHDGGKDFSHLIGGRGCECLQTQGDLAQQTLILPSLKLSQFVDHVRVIEMVEVRAFERFMRQEVLLNGGVEGPLRMAFDELGEILRDMLRALPSRGVAACQFGRSLLRHLVCVQPLGVHPAKLAGFIDDPRLSGERHAFGSMRLLLATKKLGGEFRRLLGMHQFAERVLGKRPALEHTARRHRRFRSRCGQLRAAPRQARQ